MVRDLTKFRDSASAEATGQWVPENVGFTGYWEFTCYDPDGSVAWEDVGHNLVVDEGLDLILEEYFNGSAYTAAHYVGLTDSTPTPAAGDTMASHAGWAEVVAYTESVRETYSPAAASGQSVTNGASRAAFSINTSTTVGGAFLTTDSTKSGTTGTLFAVVALQGGDQSLSNGQTLEVTYIVNAANS